MLDGIDVYRTYIFLYDGKFTLRALGEEPERVTSLLRAAE